MKQRLHLTLSVTLALGLSCACTTSSPYFGDFPDDAVMHTMARVAMRSTDHDIYGDQVAYGLEFDVYQSTAALGVELGASLASDDDRSGFAAREVDFYEGYAGARKTWDMAGGRLHPFVGVGATYVKADREITGTAGLVTAADWGAGGYVRVGIYGMVSATPLPGARDFSMGADIRYVVTEDLNFLELALLLGFGR